MSFSKAKLRRFNEKISNTPAPGAYNPNVINKTIGPIINRTERFAQNRSLFHAESTESICNVHNDRVIINTTNLPIDSQTFTDTESISTVSDTSSV